MTETRRLLVPLDGSLLAEAALAYAEALAKATDARLHLIRVVDKMFQGPLLRRAAEEHTLLQRQREDAEAYLSQMAEAVRGRGIRVSTLIRMGNPAEEILSGANELDADMVIMATHGRGGARRWVLGSVADKVLRLGTRPTLLVRADDAAAAKRVIAFRRLMVPLDGSPLAEAALAPAADLALATGASLTLVQAQPFVATTLVESEYLPDSAAWDEAISASAEQYLQTARDQVPGAVSLETVVLRGPVALALEEFIKETAVDLVVMSTHGRSGLPRMVLGSTADRLVRAGAPALLIRPPATSRHRAPRRTRATAASTPKA